MKWKQDKRVLRRYKFNFPTLKQHTSVVGIAVYDFWEGDFGKSWFPEAPFEW